VSRLQKLRNSLAQKELDVLVVSQPENRRYLSGFTGSAGWLVISNNSAYLAVDFRYVEQAKKEAPDFNVIHVKDDMVRWLPKFLSDFGFKKVGFEADQVPFATYEELFKTINDDGYRLQLIPASGLV
jgi:Xaa-Pro aminopeptidase